MWQSVDGFLTNLCPVMLSFIQDYHQGFWLVKNLKVWKYSSEPLDYDWIKRNFSSQLSYCLKIFKDQGHILVVFGYWGPVQFYPFPPKLTQVIHVLYLFFMISIASHRIQMFNHCHVIIVWYYWNNCLYHLYVCYFIYIWVSCIRVIQKLRIHISFQSFLWIFIFWPFELQ